MHEAYMCIYDGVRRYRDYSRCQRDHTIEIMYNINIVMMSFSQKNASEKLPQELLKKCRYFAVRDFDRALKNESYDSDDDDEDK
jgi:hypothetical protein